MPRSVVVLGLGVCLAIAAGIMFLGQGEPGPGPREDGTVERHATKPEAPARELAPPPAELDGSGIRPGPESETVMAAWVRARALLEEGRPIDALVVVRSLRESSPESFESPGRAELVARIEEAAVAAIEKSLADGNGRLAIRDLARLEQLVSDPASLDLLRGRVGGVGRRLALHRAQGERRVIGRARNPADRGALQRHVRRFGGESRRSGVTRGRSPVDALLAEVEQTASTGSETLPIPDPDEVEKRRIEQLEKLRQRGAVVLLDHIAAGLAWLALHQGEDGQITDETALARCRERKHKPVCVSKSQRRYPVASTALAVLAFLDFRDQDVHGLFEPALASGITWLLKQQRKDGSFPLERGYGNAVAVMALGQAATVTGRKDVRLAVGRGLAWFWSNAGPQGGFRYRSRQAGDLSVTGWVAQAVEAAGTAGLEAPKSLVERLREFWRWTWLGEARFSYLPQGPEKWTLAPVGMLAGTILEDPSIGEPARNAWRSALRGSRRRPPLYTLYYGVRVLLAMDGKLPKTWNEWILDLAKSQVGKGAAAGSFRHGRWTLPAKDTTIRTAFSVLTLEHSLYRR